VLPIAASKDSVPSTRSATCIGKARNVPDRCQAGLRHSVIDSWNAHHQPHLFVLSGFAHNRCSSSAISSSVCSSKRKSLSRACASSSASGSSLSQRMPLLLNRSYSGSGTNVWRRTECSVLQPRAVAYQRRTHVHGRRNVHLILDRAETVSVPATTAVRGRFNVFAATFLPSLCTESAVTTYSALDLDLFSQRIAVEPCAAPCLERACSAIAILEKLEVGNFVPLEPS